MIIRAFHYDTGVRKAIQSIYFAIFFFNQTLFTTKFF